jgi:hypothetical protein
VQGWDSGDRVIAKGQSKAISQVLVCVPPEEHALQLEQDQVSEVQEGGNISNFIVTALLELILILQALSLTLSQLDQLVILEPIAGKA